VITRFKPFARASAFVLAATVTTELVAQAPHAAVESRVPSNSLRAQAHLVNEPAGDERLLFLPPNPNPPHLVLEPPRPRPQNAYPSHGTQYGVVEDGTVVGPYEVSPQASQAPAASSSHHDKLKNQFLHADKREQPVAIPNANRVPVWKTPYSYGHFGASRNRQWSLHRGHQESYLQWTLR
jgi:hypothetical protein